MMILVSGLYSQTNIDFNNIDLDRIHQPDSLAQRIRLKSKKIFRRWADEKERMEYVTVFNKKGYRVKEINYGIEATSDTIETIIEIFPDSMFEVTYKLDTQKQLRLGRSSYFSSYEDQIKHCEDKGIPFVLRLLYKANADSTFEIVSFVNGKKLDSIHYISNCKMVHDAKNEDQPYVAKDTVKINDSLVVVTIDTSDLSLTRVKRVYFVPGSHDWVKEEYLNFNESNKLVHQGITYRNFDSIGRITYYAQQIGGEFTEIERTNYDSFGAKTVQRSANPAEGKRFPDNVANYDRNGRLMKVIRNSNRESNTQSETLYFYNKKNLLIKIMTFVDKKYMGMARYEYDYWSK